MEGSNHLTEVGKNISDFQQRQGPRIDENYSRQAALSEVGNLNENAAATERNVKEAFTNEDVFTREEKNICVFSNSTISMEANVNKVNGLAAIADSYSEMDSETFEENSTDSVNCKDTFQIENELCKGVENNNIVNKSIDTISASEKATLMESQKNDLNSVNLMDTLSQSTEVETDRVVSNTMKGPENTLLETVNIDDTVIEPVNINETVKEPMNVRNLVTEHASMGNTVKKPVNIGNAAKEPVSVGNIVIEPVNIEDTVKEPANAGRAVTVPVNVENIRTVPVNIGNIVTEPVSIGDTIIESVNAENESENASNAIRHSDIVGNEITAPVIKSKNIPSDSDTILPIYTMSNINRELDDICEKGSTAQTENIIQGDHSSSDSASDSDDESSSSETSTSSESSSEDDLEDIRREIEKEEEQVPKGPLKTRSEVMIKDLPEVPDLDISIDENVQLVELGLVFSIVESLVVVKAFPQTPALDSDSILFLENRTCLGLVFETFGPVQTPFYSVRFNKESDISDKNIHVGDKVFYAPDIMEYSHFVFVAQLKRLKGSDASWEHDEEPPQEALEYSDDEEEANARASKKKERMGRSGSSANDENTQKTEENKATFNQGANRGNRKRTWQNRTKGQSVNQNQKQGSMPNTNLAPMQHPVHRGPAPWHGSPLPVHAPERPYMGPPFHEAVHLRMSPMGPPSRFPPGGPPPRAPLNMASGPLGQFPVTYPGPMTSLPRPSFAPSRPIARGPDSQGLWPGGPPSGFTPRYPIPAPQGFQDPGANIQGLQGREFMSFSMPPPPPPPPPNI